MLESARLEAITAEGGLMKTSKVTEEQIAYALRQVEGGTQGGEVCRRLGISEQTFYRWKAKFGQMGVS
jgi:putative transposase